MDKIAIVDFGSRYMELIDLRLREFGIETEIIQPEETEEIKDPEIKGLILSGGPESVIDITSPKPHPNLFEVDKPVLGICYGHQVIATQLGGEVERFDEKEYGEKEIEVKTKDRLFAGVSQKTKVWMSHYDFVIHMPEEFETLIGREGIITAYKHKNKELWGIQFHPEVYRNQEGRKILKNFLDICGCTPQFSAPDFAQKTADKLTEKLRGKKSVVLLNGSSEDYVAAQLAASSIEQEKNLIVLFVDHGLHRQEEKEHVKRLFGARSDLRIKQPETSLFKQLQGMTKLTEKQEVIGNSLNKIVQSLMEKEDIDYYLNSEISRDRRKERTRLDEGEPKQVDTYHGSLETISPISELNQNELRGLSNHLNLPDVITHRSSLLDPKIGLAAQVAGQVTREKITALKKADKIIIKQLRSSGILDKYAHIPRLLTDPFNGISGNEADEYLLTLSFSRSQASRNPSFRRPKWKLLDKIVEAISTQIPAISSVHYDISCHKRASPTDKGN